MTQLEKAIQIALHAHKGQKDKAGYEYILHPLRLMTQMQSRQEKMIAILHDVVEDSDVTFSDLKKQGFSESVLEILNLLTHDKKNIPYRNFIKKIKTNPIAVKIKLADLEDNMDIKRIKAITEKDVKRLQKYQWAWHYLKQ